MKEIGELLYFQRSESVDRAVITVAKRVLRDTGDGDKAGQAAEAETPSLRKRLQEWLNREAVMRPLLVSADDVASFIKIVESQVEIAEETPGSNHPRGTSAPHEISLAKGALPDMQKFVDGQAAQSASE